MKVVSSFIRIMVVLLSISQLLCTILVHLYRHMLAQQRLLLVLSVCLFELSNYYYYH